MAILLADIPQVIIDKYNLLEIAHNGNVYVKICKCMYGLPQAGCIANDKLIPILAKAGYHQAKHILGLFKHKSGPIAFGLKICWKKSRQTTSSQH